MIKHLDGICHVYVDAEADLDMARPHRRQRQDAALRPLQHDGDAARRRSRSPPRVLPRLGAHLRDQGRGAARLPGSARVSLPAPVLPARRPPRMTGAPNTWRRSSRSASSPASTRRSRTSTATVASTPMRSSRGPRARDALPARSRFGLGDGQRVDALRRRLRIRPRRRDRHLATTSCTRAGRSGLEGLTSQKYVVFGHGEVRT